MKKDVVIFPDDPYEQKLIAAHDAIMAKCKKQEDEEKRKREERGDLTARSLIAPIQFYENDKEVAVVNAYDELCAKYKERLAPDENPILVLSQGGVYYDNQNVAAASSNPYMSTQQYMTPYNGAGGSTHSFPAEKRHTAVPTATDLLGCLLKRVTLKRDGDAIYMFDGVCYNRLSDNAVNTMISKMLSEELKISGAANQLNNVYTLLKAESSIWAQPEKQSISPYLAVENGLLNRKNLMLSAATPDRFITSKINVSWNPLSSCPLFENFLYTCANGDSLLISRLWDFVAFALIPNEIKRIALLQGVGDSGKTLLTALIESFYSKGAVSHRDVHRLGDRFSLFDLVDKRLNISADLPAGALSSNAIAVLKQISGNDRVAIEEKYHNPRSVELEVRLVIVTNHTLSMQHYDQQFANRILLLPFMHAVPPTHQDHMLLEKLKNEREGILAKAVRVFNQLESRNFVFSGDALYSFERQAVSSIPVEANAVKKFISACCELKEGFTPTSTLHNHYLSYCDANGYPPINDKTAFSKQLSLTCGNAVSRKKQRYGGEPVNGYMGIVLKGGV